MGLDQLGSLIRNFKHRASNLIVLFLTLLLTLLLNSPGVHPRLIESIRNPKTVYSLLKSVWRDNRRSNEIAPTYFSFRFINDGINSGHDVIVIY